MSDDRIYLLYREILQFEEEETLISANETRREYSSGCVD